MTARQVFFGALGFRAPGDLEHAVRDTLAGAGPHVERLVHDARRGDRTLVFDVEGHLPSSLFSAITGCLSELAACAARGRVSMVYVGDGVEIAHACAPPESGRDASGAVTQRWLSLVGERASIVHPMVVGSDAARFLQPGWRERSMSTRRLWLRPGVGVVAIG